MTQGKQRWHLGEYVLEHPIKSFMLQRVAFSSRSRVLHGRRPTPRPQGPVGAAVLGGLAPALATIGQKA